MVDLAIKFAVLGFVILLYGAIVFTVAAVLGGPVILAIIVDTVALVVFGGIALFLRRHPY